MKDYKFGREHFENLTKATTYRLAEHDDLTDHGFFASAACVWCKELKGHEIAVVSRTYVANDVIDNPPDGLKIVRLPPKFMGKEDQGTAIATVIVKDTPEANKLLNKARHLPASQILYMLSENMLRDGYIVAIRRGDYHEKKVDFC